MVEFLNSFKPELSNESSSINKKILCILEGKEELKYIYNVFKLNGYDKLCDELAKEKIKVSWGRNRIEVKRCNFQGGGCYGGCPVPVPALESYEFEKDNLWLYDSIIVMFDTDKDKNHKVEDYFISKQTDQKDIILLASNPCFESSLIDYCKCGNCRTAIETIEDGKYPCDKYKNNFSSLNCFDGVSNLISRLDEYALPDNEILCNINSAIEENVGVID